MNLEPSIIKRFWDKVEMIPFHDCWEWTGNTTRTGYGRLKIHRRKLKIETYALAHRLSLEINGIKLKEGLVVDHLCRNRACVKPTHLRQVTQKMNAVENSLGASAINSKKTHCPKGHEYSQRPKKRFCRKCKNKQSKEYRLRLKCRS